MSDSCEFSKAEIKKWKGCQVVKEETKKWVFKKYEKLTIILLIFMLFFSEQWMHSAWNRIYITVVT